MEPDNRTLDYYNINAESFVDGTINAVFTDVQKRFLSYIPENGLILDFGCGSGRDSKYFLQQGYQVDAVDGSEKVCELASQNTGLNVRKMIFSELDECNMYDGIWACASILHLPKRELTDVIKRMILAVKPGGYIYTSFKYGKYEGYRNDRYFTDFTTDSFRELLKDYTNTAIVEMWVSSDVRPGRGNERWLNSILQRLNTN